MTSGSPASLLRSVLGLALCAVAAAGCGKKPQPVPQRPNARVRLTVRAHPEGIFTLKSSKLEDLRGDQWIEDHYPRIAQKLTPSDIGTDEIKDISLKGQEVTIRTRVRDAADCEQQAGRIKQLLSDLYADIEPVSASTSELMSSNLDEIEHVVEARAEAAGLSDLSVEPRPPDSLFVEFACSGDPEWAKAVLTETGLLQFRVIPRRYAHGTDRMAELTHVGGKAIYTFQDETGMVVDTSRVVAESPVIVSGRDFAPTSHVEVRSEVRRGQRTCVTFSLEDEARGAFYAFTRDHVDSWLAIVLDGELISCPIIRSAVPGEGVIEGGFDEPGGRDRAEKLAIVINCGPLPLHLECVESRTEQLPP